MKFLRTLSICLLTTSMMISSSAYASFQVPYVDGAYMGDQGSLGVAGGFYASTSITNPAALTRIMNPQMNVSLNALIAKINFKGTLSQTFPDILDPGEFVTVTRSGSSNSPLQAPLPTFFMSYPVNCNLVIGGGISAPWGERQSFRKRATTVARYFINDGLFKAFDFNIGAGYKVLPCLSIGAGVAAEYLTTDLSAVSLFDESTFNLSVYSVAPVWYVGLLYQVTNNLRVGLNYRHRTIHHEHGQSSISDTGLKTAFPGAPKTGDTTRHTKVKQKMPLIASFGLFWDIDCRLSLYGVLNFIEWAYNDKVKFKNTILPDPLTDFTTINNWRSIFYGSIAAMYKLSNCWTVKGAIGYQPGDIPKKHKVLALPSSSNYTFSVGAHYIMNQYIEFDFGALYTQLHRVSIDHTSVFGQTQVGSGKTTSWGMGFQLTWNICPRIPCLDPYRIYKNW